MRNTPRTLPVTIPIVAHKGPHDTDAVMFRQAADNLDSGYPLGGGNLTAAVVTLLRRIIAAARESGDVSGDHAKLLIAADCLDAGLVLMGTLPALVANLLKGAAAALEPHGGNGPCEFLYTEPS